MSNGEPTRDELLEELHLAELECQVVIKETTERLALAEEKIKCSHLALVLKRISNANAHEIWAAAQLLPGEGIEDGVERVERVLSNE